MRNAFRAAAAAAIALFAAAPSLAVVVDGIVSAGEYGAPNATILTNAMAPESNFGAPTTSALAGYNFYLSDIGDTLYGAFVQTGGTAGGTFANLYFDVDPLNGGGSNMGIEVTNSRGFVPGSAGYFDMSQYISFVSTTSGGLITTEFSIAESAFRDYIAGGQAQGAFLDYTPQKVQLRMAQALSYTVSVGGSSRTARMGEFSILASEAPEPATWAMMLAGFGAIGFAMRRRKSSNAVFARG